MRFLSELVPHESSLYLRTHLTQSIHTPRGCQQLLRDYQQLARARLSDLNALDEVPAVLSDKVWLARYFICDSCSFFKIFLMI